MKSFPTHSIPKRASATVRTTSRPQPPSTMRSTVLQSLLLCPDGGVSTHRHGQGSPASQVR